MNLWRFFLATFEMPCGSQIQVPVAAADDEAAEVTGRVTMWLMEQQLEQRVHRGA